MLRFKGIQCLCCGVYKHKSSLALFNMNYSVEWRWQHIHFSVFVERERCDTDCNQSIALTYIGNLILPLVPRHIVENSLESIAANAKSVLSFVSVIHLSINENVEQNHIVCVCVCVAAAGLLPT